MKPNSKIQLAIIGYGGMARWHHFRMKLSGYIDVTGVYDISGDACKRASEKGLRVYQSAQELLSDSLVEAVLIATPNDSHEQYVIAAAQAGKHIICEKPATLGSASLQKMIDAAKAGKVTFIVHQNRRWDRDYLRMKYMLAHPSLGKVYKIVSNVSSSHGLPGEWRKEKAKGGGMLWDWGVHLIDQMLTATDSTVIGVSCRADYVYGFDVDDSIDMHLDFDGGIQANIIINTNDFIKCPRWKVYGENGTGIIKGWNHKGKMVIVKERLDKKNKGINAGNGFTKTMADRSRSTIKHIRLHAGDVPPRKPTFYKGFYDTVRLNAPQLISNDSVMRCMRVMEAGFEAIAKKEIIKTDI